MKEKRSLLLVCEEWEQPTKKSSESLLKLRAKYKNVHLFKEGDEGDDEDEDEDELVHLKIDTVVWKKGKGFFSYEIRAVEMKDGKAQRGEEDSFEQLPINEDLFKCIMSTTKAGLNNHIHFVAAPEAEEMEVEE